MNIKLVYIVFSIAICIFIIGIIAKLDAPLVMWDSASYSPAERWSKGINSPWLHDQKSSASFVQILFLFHYSSEPHIKNQKSDSYRSINVPIVFWVVL